MAIGICKLTGDPGLLIKSHLIPKALTRSGIAGTALVQFGTGLQPVRRWDSWYDSHLVIQKGEDILTDLDTWAIAELRRNKLVWSGWSEEGLSGHFDPIDSSGLGVRKIVGLDTRRLRLFFISLLWRAAATDRPEFNEVKVPPEDLEVLRNMVLAGNADPASFYWISLTQLSSRGEAHNFVPIRTEKEFAKLDGSDGVDLVPVFRFYFDGLIAHFHLPHPTNDRFFNGSLILGADEDLTVSTVPYEHSFQYENMRKLKAEHHRVRATVHVRKPRQRD